MEADRSGDWFSFSRIMSLGLGTAGMAMAINLLCLLIYDMVGSPFILIVIIPLLIIAHLANLFLQALGAGVHSLRLEYVEMFSKFYAGGGKIFAPFTENRQFTAIRSNTRGVRKVDSATEGEHIPEVDSVSELDHITEVDPTDPLNSAANCISSNCISSTINIITANTPMEET